MRGLGGAINVERYHQEDEVLKAAYGVGDDGDLEGTMDCTFLDESDVSNTGTRYGRLSGWQDHDRWQIKQHPIPARRSRFGAHSAPR
jgi:hypothetical protein